MPVDLEVDLEADLEADLDEPLGVVTNKQDAAARAMVGYLLVVKIEWKKQ